MFPALTAIAQTTITALIGTLVAAGLMAAAPQPAYAQATAGPATVSSEKVSQGLGILMLELPPRGGEIVRALAFLLAPFVYAGVWLAVAPVFSAVFRSPPPSAPAAGTLRLLFTHFWSMLAPLIANSLVTGDPLNPLTALHQLELERAIRLDRGATGAVHRRLCLVPASGDPGVEMLPWAEPPPRGLRREAVRSPHG